MTNYSTANIGCRAQRTEWRNVAETQPCTLIETRNNYLKNTNMEIFPKEVLNSFPGGLKHHRIVEHFILHENCIITWNIPTAIYIMKHWKQEGCNNVP